MLRRLHPEQPETFAFTEANRAWAEAQIKKFPEGRQASAIIPLLWRAQEQEGWLTRPAIEYVAKMLDMAYIRALEVATFYFMFQLQPVGKIAHVQVCGTLSCMICGAEDLIGICKEKIAPAAHQLSADGNFSWEEVECLGSCANAPMVQIGKDYYEDLTAERFVEILDELAAGRVPVPGPQNGRYAAEPLKGLTSLKDYESGHTQYNASAQLAVDIGDTVKRIDGTEVPLLTPWVKDTPPQPPANAEEMGEQAETAASPAFSAQTDKPGHEVSDLSEEDVPHPDEAQTEAAEVTESQPATLDAPREGKGDDLKKLSGVGPKIEAKLNEMGIWHYDQIASWTDAEVAWVDAQLKFKGRIARDGWIAQARDLSGK